MNSDHKSSNCNPNLNYQEDDCYASFDSIPPLPFLRRVKWVYPHKDI